MADRQVDEQEWRDFRLNQQRAAVLLERVRLELETHLREASPQARHVSQYLMDPENGAVVKIRRLQDAQEALAGVVGKNGVEANKVAGLETRLATIENERRAEKAAAADKRQWTWRQVVVPFLCVVAALVIERLIDFILTR